MPTPARTIVLAHYHHEELDVASAALILGIHPRYVLRVWHDHLQWYAEINYPLPPSPSAPSPSTGRATASTRGGAGVGDGVRAQH